MKFKFRHIYINRSARDDEVTRRVLQYYKGVASTFISDSDRLSDRLSEFSVKEGKQVLLLTRFKSNFLRPCPGTAASYRCCNYLVINETTNCPIDCSYCILQTYINNPVIIVYTNTDHIVHELQSLSSLNLERILRVGTGELTDSLALDPVTGLSEQLLPQIQKLPNVLLELKTKTDHIYHLLTHNPWRIIISWSINPLNRVKSDEKKSAPLFNRLKAAQKAMQHGFLIGLHFDPIIYEPEWAQNYRELIEQLSDYLEGHRIAWISLGSFRYPPALHNMIRQRFPKSNILSGEHVSGMDGKMRYIKPLRREMYQLIIEHLREKFGEVFIYFCMESEDLWTDLLGKTPKNNLEVDWLFASHVYQKFPELQLPRPEQNLYNQPIRWKSVV